MKKLLKFLLATVLCLTAVMPMFACGASLGSASAYVTVDINPSVEFICDENGKVIIASALNDDARIVLSDIDFTGEDIEEAVKRLTKESEELGYINDTNTDVSIDCSSDDLELQLKIDKKAKKGAKEGSKKAVIKLDQKALDLLQEVEELKNSNPELYKDLTPAILRMVKRIAEFDRDFTVEIALTMSKEELISLLHEYLHQHKDLITKEMRIEFNEQFLNMSKGILEQIDAIYGEEYQTQMAILRKLEILEDKFEEGLKVPGADDDLSENAQLTEQMKAELAEIIGENQIADLEGLDEYIDQIEDQVEQIKESVELTPEQRQLIDGLMKQLENFKQTIMQGMKTHIEQAKDDFLQKKNNRKQGFRP